MPAALYARPHVISCQDIPADTADRKPETTTRFTKTLSDGRRVTYFYAWKGSPRLPGRHGSQGFVLAYQTAIASRSAASGGQLELRYFRLRAILELQRPFRLRQRKTGRHITIPLGQPLKEFLSTAPHAADTILATTRASADGAPRPWTSDGLRASWAKVVARAGIKGVTFHDLRGTSVTRLALAGWSVPEIASITGHALKETNNILDSHYLSRDSGLAAQAIRKREAHGAGPSFPTAPRLTIAAPRTRTGPSTISRRCMVAEEGFEPPTQGL
ncbi:tyrosine-type recombinase/integrase [Acidimangrovimonas sediminis]|uniref:Tyrosine-type recombinase/integrase n=2 Tax=Albidovulum sediminis TaxID=3066345 RepID=A0ABT2NV47_9RHOB|nr:tyrosine-type recombinase/integrase [Defluviimonas sediminis]MCT8331474.1 tyrosine-type recombinase/integrase [Defluviimonas sediminis]